MKVFNLFKRKSKSLIKETTEELNKTIVSEPESNTTLGLTRQYSDKVPPPFPYDEKLEFLKYISNRGIDNLSEYRTSDFKDYKKVINEFSSKGYLIDIYRNNLESFKATELKEILKDHDLKVSGKKLDLIERIIENTNEENIKNNYNYKQKYTLSSTADYVLSKYYDEKNKYNQVRDEIIYQEELKKEKPDQVLLLKFEDLENSFEFKSSLSKAILLSKFQGERYEHTSKRFAKQNKEKLNCPALDEFLENPDGRLAKRVSTYEEKLQLYIMYQLNKSQYLHLENQYLKSSPINANLKIMTDPKSCQCSICPTENKIYTKEDYINKNIPQYLHHYGCMCFVGIDLSDI